MWEIFLWMVAGGIITLAFSSAWDKNDPLVFFLVALPSLLLWGTLAAIISACHGSEIETYRGTALVKHFHNVTFSETREIQTEIEYMPGMLPRVKFFLRYEDGDLIQLQ